MKRGHPILGPYHNEKEVQLKDDKCTNCDMRGAGRLASDDNGFLACTCPRLTRLVHMI